MDCEDLDIQVLKSQIQDLSTQLSEAKQHSDSAKKEYDSLKEKFEAVENELNMYRRKEADALISEIMKIGDFNEEELKGKEVDELKGIREILVKAKKPTGIQRATDSSQTNPRRQLTVGMWDPMKKEWVS